MESMRIDKWLWAARFFKTRSIAQDEVSLGRVLIGGVRAKPSREIRPGDRLEIHRGQEVFTVYVEALSNQRGPAAQAQTLYRETPESVEARARAREMQKLAAEPALAVDRGRGRPTKKEGRELRRFKSSFWES